jgi:hypothetical protein
MERSKKYVIANDADYIQKLVAILTFWKRISLMLWNLLQLQTRLGDSGVRKRIDVVLAILTRIETEQA